MNGHDETEGTAAGGEQLADADALWLDASLREVIADESPPDLRARIAAATPAQAAAAAARVDAARAAPSGSRWLAAAVLLFGVLVVGGVFVLQRAGTGGDDPSLLLQEPIRELEIADGKQLAAHLARTTTLALTALCRPDGARLPNEPEHGGLVHGSSWLPMLREALGAEVAIGAPFGSREVQAELRLGSEAGFVRLRVAITDQAVRVGTARFACTAPLPAALATGLRGEWQVLAAQQPPPRQRMQVHTQRQLIAAIGNDRTIELIGGPFVLTGRDDDGELPVNPAVEFRDPSPVPFLVLKNVRNLRFCALGGPVQVLGKSPADVVRCEDCSGVTFEGLILGHDTGVEHFCSAPVLTLQRCKSIVVRDCELFGCGTEGVVAEQVEEFRMERGEIHTCSNGVVRFHRSKGVAFHGVRMRDCRVQYSAFVFGDSERVLFTDCIVRGLDSTSFGAADDDFLFGITMDEPVRFVRGQIRGNRTNRLVSSKLLLVREGTDEGDNGPDVEPARRDR